jgi:DNA-binding CsgD family transcriptional regulator
MAPPLRPRAVTIRLALRIVDPHLRARIVRACEQTGIVLAGPGDAADDADIVLADRPPGTAAPVIAIAGARPRGWRCDVRAVVPPDLDDATFGAVISAVAAGFTVMPREAIGRSGAWANGPAGDDAEFERAPSGLTPREREVLALLAEGASNKAIARALSVSVHTAKFHISSLIEKLGAARRQEAVAIAIRSGLLML